MDSVFMYLGEVFLDVLIDRSFSSKYSKKSQIISTIIFFFITLFYISLFILILYIALAMINKDEGTSIKLFITDLLLLIAFLVYGSKMIKHWKRNRKS